MCIKRAEAVALLKELGEAKLVEPSFVIIEKNHPDIYQLKIKGRYNFQEIELLLKERLLVEEFENCLVISSL